MLPLSLEKLQFAIQNKSRSVFRLPKGFSRAAVLIPFFIKNDKWFLLFTRRTGQVRHHQNQISFPGGRADENDKDLIHTALREANEEVGIKNPKIIGLIDDIVTISSYIVTPVLGYLPDNSAHAKISTSEIEYLLEVPLTHLADPKFFSIKTIPYEDKVSFQVPYFDYHGEIIWGATARILVNLLNEINDLEDKYRSLLVGGSQWKEIYLPGTDLKSLEKRGLINLEKR